MLKMSDEKIIALTSFNNFNFVLNYNYNQIDVVIHEILNFFIYECD